MTLTRKRAAGKKENSAGGHAARQKKKGKISDGEERRGRMNNARGMCNEEEEECICV